ncbi:DUF1080 domain-containing protein [Winogradskyella litoriviva]|uniref:DUF1080 domain-containing protein n=1 Tax=Winogradskyella litoriviva TaxID=1220182 RepID=A0ABX2E5F9_9FLAO|nr:DUF1080 domain-containing protein [Winogradskyella litoriviva]NRD23729.1 DUF1080 domain-containing protein [Winogradskyella litoriviva]
MKKINKISAVILVIFSLVFSCNHSEKLFQENSNTWKSYGDNCWHFSENELIGEVKNQESYLITKQRFKDFDLNLEFKPDNSINTGVFIRCINEDVNPKNCYELNIWDLHPDQTNRTGAIVARVNPRVVVSTINKWNTYRIKAVNSHIQVWINDTLTIDTIDNALREGYIGLQAKATGKVSFRNINIQTID